VTRRSLIVGGAALVLVAGVATGVVLGFRGGSGSLTPEEYLDRTSAVCLSYARQMDVIPPPDPTSAAEVVASVGKALPILRAQADAVRRIHPPRELQARVRTFFERTDRSLAALAAQLAAARRHDLPAMKARFGDWLAASVAAQAASRKVGYRCG
jgi:hypothetical protein